MTERRWSGDEYDRGYDVRAASGENVHGEADFVDHFAARSVLDAGCGTGRVGRELARRGADVVGVDRDASMLATAERRAPDCAWYLADIASVDLGRTFDAVLMAGNVMLFVDRGTEGVVLANMVRHLAPDGVLIAGFELQPRGLSVERYDALAAAVGLEVVERWATWDREPWQSGGHYAVSVHRRVRA
jgi:trans-aconitate methyltransferase